MENNRRIAVRTDEKTFEAVKAAAAAAGLSINGWINTAIRKELRRETKGKSPSN